MADKLTIKAGFTRALEMYKSLGDEEMIAFFEKRLEQENKKSAHKGERKLTPHQIENEKIKEGILNSMEANRQYSISEMLLVFKCFPADMTVARLSALLTQLGAKGTGEIVRTEVKGKAFFALAE